MIERGDPNSFWFVNWTKGGHSSLSNAGYVISEEEQDQLLRKFSSEFIRWGVDGCHVILHLEDGRVLLCRKAGEGLDAHVEVKYAQYSRQPNQFKFFRFWVSVKTVLPLLETLKKAPEKRWRFPALLIFGKHQEVSPSDN